MDPLQAKAKGVGLGADILFWAETVQDHLRFEKQNTRPDGGTTFWFQIRDVRGTKTASRGA